LPICELKQAETPTLQSPCRFMSAKGT